MRTGTSPPDRGHRRGRATACTGSGLMSRMPALRLCQSRACAGVICQYSGLPASADLLEHRRDLRIKRHRSLRLAPVACTNACASSAVSKMCGATRRRGERLAELQPQERARRVARRRRVVVRLHVADHRRVGVGDRGVDHEVVVVDDQRDLLADLLAQLLDDAPDAVDVVAVAHLHAFEVEEQRVALGVVADALGEARARAAFPRAASARRGRCARPSRAGVADDRREVHVREDVALDVDARRHLDRAPCPRGVRRNTQRSVT